MSSHREATFVIGADYHLGDLLWLTAVLAEYRDQRKPVMLRLSLPDSSFGRILERNPVIDELDYRGVGMRPQLAGTVHDLRMIPIGVEMVRQWRNRRPWLYYRDLWLEPRGQWLATYLGLGQLHEYCPSLVLDSTDVEAAPSMAQRSVVLAPHIGTYSFPVAGNVWKRIKGWSWSNWIQLAQRLRDAGFDPVTLGASDQVAIPGTRAVMGLPIRRAAGAIARASALVSGESGLWFIAAALDVPFAIVPWWLPASVDWPKPMDVRYALVRRREATVEAVLNRVLGLVAAADVKEDPS